MKIPLRRVRLTLFVSKLTHWLTAFLCFQNGICTLLKRRFARFQSRAFVRLKLCFCAFRMLLLRLEKLRFVGVLGDGRPVHFALFLLFKMVPEHCVFGLFAIGVGLYYASSLVAGKLNELSVARYVGNL